MDGNLSTVEKQNNLKETVQTKAEEQQNHDRPVEITFFYLIFILTISCDLLKFTNEKHMNSF